MPQLFDLSGSDDRTLNYHLECLCKALSEPQDPADGGKGDMWDLHPSVFLQQLVEAFTSIGLSMSEEMKAELLAWASGQMHAGAGGQPPHHPLHGGTGGGAPGGGGGAQPPYSGGSALVPVGITWSPEVAAAVREYLLSKPLASWAVDDWLLLVDYLAFTHTPPGWAQQQAEFLATRAGLMAQVEHLHPQATLAQVGNVLAAMPNTLAQALAMGVHLKPQHVAAMAFGRARTAENIQHVDDQLRHSIRGVILDAMEQSFGQAAGAPLVSNPALQTRLFDAFGQFNRDWRRIAVTEAGEIKNQGFIALQDPGEFVRRVERYRGACTFCRNLDGRVFKVVDPGDQDKDGTKEVWAGKTNVGRSASPNKRVDGELVPRLPQELWWAAAGVQHPHCRGTWVQVRAPSPTSSDKAWKEWLAHLGLDGGGK